MRLFTLILMLMVSLVALTTGTARATVEIKLPVPELETLSNGLQLVWFLSDKLPVVDLALLVKSGYRDDPSGKSGTAEFLSATLDRGAGGMNAKQIAHAVEMLGASRYISVDEDASSLGMHGLAPDAPVLLDLLAKVSLQPEFPEQDMIREHARLLDRWSHMGDYSESLASLAFHRLLTAGTPYGRGNFLSIKEFKKVNRADVLAFHKRHFTPKNSILMIVGRVNKAEFKEKILAAFGKWQGEAPSPAERAHAMVFTDKRLPRKKGQIIVVERKGLNQAQVRMGFPAPLLKAPEHYSLAVVNALLGEYFGSRLNSVIRDKLGLTYSIGSAFSYSKDFGRFSISSASGNETVGELVQKTREILQDLKDQPIPAIEVQQAKEYLIGGFPLSVATLGSVASRWLSGFIFDRGPDYLNELVPKIAEVTPQSVMAAVAKDFKLDQLVIVVAGDGAEIEKSFKASGVKNYKKISPQDLM